MSIPSTITIDGPAASGKSTLGLKLARRLGYLLLDTGNMYRAVTLAAIEEKIDIYNEEAVSQLAESVLIDVLPPSKEDGRLSDVLLDGKDVTWEIRRTEVEANVSQVSAYYRVRAAMTLQQRRIGHRGSVVMVGRDIGTVVLPDAELKIFLDASLEERARRRYKEIVERDGEADFSKTLEALKKRDVFDSTRQYAPLKPADDAILLNTDNLTIDDVLDTVLEMIGI